MIMRPGKLKEESRLDEGKRLRKALKANKVTQYQLADHLGVSQAQVSQWLSPKDPRSCPDYAFIEAASWLGFDPSVHRPYLHSLKEGLNKSLTPNSEIGAKDIILSFKNLTRESQLRLMGHFEEILDSNK